MRFRWDFMMLPAIKKVKVEAQSLNDYPGATWAYGTLPLGVHVNFSDIYGNGLTHVGKAPYEG